MFPLVNTISTTVSQFICMGPKKGLHSYKFAHPIRQAKAELKPMQVKHRGVCYNRQR